MFRSVLGRRRHILEYQVRQTASGADIAGRCIGPVDLEELGAEIARELKTLGLDDPQITVVPVDRLERLARRGS